MYGLFPRLHEIGTINSYYLPETILKIKKGKYTIKVYNKDENEKLFFLSDKIIYACEGKNRTQTNFHRKIIFFPLLDGFLDPFEVLQRDEIKN